jgi:peptidyl-prolyl cis-trans isomerase A (cyclophilin A)
MTETLTATLTTSQGTITIQLFPDHAPKTVRNFVELAEKGFYDGTIFHRVISQFMVQGGDPTGTGTGGPGYEFDDEIHPDLTFDHKYQLAMANAGKRGGRGTNGSQFFITVGEPYWLNGKHTIFGDVVAGQDVVDKISNVSTRPGDRPATDVVLQSVAITRGTDRI